MYKNIFITGGSGFVGSYIIKRLIEETDCTIVAYQRSASLPEYINIASDRIEIIQGDILDVVFLEESMQGCDAVIHAGGFVSFRKKDKELLMKINTEGTANVINAALQNNIKRFIHISSVATLNPSANGLVTEEINWDEKNQKSNYAVSKYYGELEVWRGIAEGLSAAIINPTTVLGYGDWSDGSCAIFKTYYDGFSFYPSGANGFVAVEDVAKIAVQLLDTNITSERFIVCGENLSYKNLFSFIAKGFNKKPPTHYAPKWMGKIAMWRDQIKSVILNKKPVLTKETWQTAYAQSVYDNSKLLTALKNLNYTPLEKYINETCMKYLEGIK